MPVWLTVFLIAIAVVAALSWAEMRASAILAELQAIRENLDALRALAEEDVADASGANPKP